MAKTSLIFDNKVKEAIKKALALDPLMTQTALLTYLNKSLKHSFDSRYIKRLMERVINEGRMEAVGKDVKDRLIEMIETFRITRKRLLEIMFWTPENNTLPQPTNEEVITACKTVILLDLKILEAQFANGFYKKNRAQWKEEKENTYLALSPEIREGILATYRNHGVVPKEYGRP